VLVTKHRSPAYSVREFRGAVSSRFTAIRERGAASTVARRCAHGGARDDRRHWSFTALRLRGLIKAAIVSFGERMPEDAMQRAQRGSRRGRSLPRHRSSLQVQPAATLPVIAKTTGARLAIVIARRRRSTVR